LKYLPSILFAAGIFMDGRTYCPAVAVLPGVLRDKAPERLLQFESGFEKLGMTALLVQVITGLLLARR